MVEIDLLRSGSPFIGRAGLPYNRWNGERHRRFVCPMYLRQPLKRIPIPVRQEDRDALLNLQVVLDTVYERAGYGLRVNYKGLPACPFRDENSEWSRALLSK